MRGIATQAEMTRADAASRRRTIRARLGVRTRIRGPDRARRVAATRLFAIRDEDHEAFALHRYLRLRDEDFFDVMEDHFDLARSVFADLSAQRERVLNRLAQSEHVAANSLTPSKSGRAKG
jgi:hypothetical protein